MEERNENLTPKDNAPIVKKDPIKQKRSFVEVLREKAPSLIAYGTAVATLVSGGVLVACNPHPDQQHPTEQEKQQMLQEFSEAWTAYESAWAKYSAAVTDYQSIYEVELPVAYSHTQLVKKDFEEELKTSAVKTETTKLETSTASIKNLVSQKEEANKAAFEAAWADYQAAYDVYAQAFANYDGDTTGLTHTKLIKTQVTVDQINAGIKDLQQKTETLGQKIEESNRQKQEFETAWESYRNQYSLYTQSVVAYEQEFEQDLPNEYAWGMLNKDMATLTDIQEDISILKELIKSIEAEIEAHVQASPANVDWSQIHSTQDLLALEHGQEWMQQIVEKVWNASEEKVVSLLSKFLPTQSEILNLYGIDLTDDAIKLFVEYVNGNTGTFYSLVNIAVSEPVSFESILTNGVPELGRASKDIQIPVWSDVDEEIGISVAQKLDTEGLLSYKDGDIVLLLKGGAATDPDLLCRTTLVDVYVLNAEKVSYLCLWVQDDTSDFLQNFVNGNGKYKQQENFTYDVGNFAIVNLDGFQKEASDDYAFEYEGQTAFSCQTYEEEN